MQQKHSLWKLFLVVCLAMFSVASAMAMAADAATHSISGHVVGRDGHGIAGVQVRRSGGEVTVRTDDNGAFTFTGLPAGTFIIYPHQEGLVIDPNFRSITVADADVSDVNFTATQLFRISGRVTTAAGAGIPGVVIRRSGSDRFVLTNSNGEYLLPAVQAGGPYTITALRDGFRFSPRSQPVTITDGNVSGINFTGERITFSITGRVTNRAGVGIGGVHVRRSGGEVVVTTNERGIYVFTGLLPGNYVVAPFQNGIAFDPRVRQVAVHDGNVTDVNFVGARSFSIYGHVTDASGAGIAGVHITISGSDRSAVSNTTGGYLLPAVQTGGPYTVTPFKEGFAFTPRSRSVTVGDGNTTGVDFVGAPMGFSISGHITTADGSSAPGVRLSLSGSDRVAFSNANGEFTFLGVRPGTYTVTPTQDGNTFDPGSREVTIASSNVTDADFTAAHAIVVGGITGRVTNHDGAGVPGVHVALSPDTTTTTGPTGEYHFAGLGAGAYTVTPSLTGFTFDPPSRSVTVGTSLVTGVNFVATRTVVSTPGIAGRVVNGDTAGVAGVTLTLSGSGATTTTNANGEYHFDNLAAGTYTVTPSLTGNTFDPASRSVPVGTTLVTGINFRIIPAVTGFTISGRVSYGTTGTTFGLAGAHVALSGSTVVATTNANGEYHFDNLATGTYTVTPTFDGVTMSPLSQMVTVSTANVTGVNFTATRNVFSISGRVTDVAGVGVANVAIRRSGSDTPVMTDTSGVYSFHDVPAGTYTITPSADATTFNPASLSVTGTTGSVTGVNFTATHNPV